jgi:beta-glucosidase
MTLPDGFPGPAEIAEGLHLAQYSEGLLAGCRWYDAQKMEPLFAFGHGLYCLSVALFQCL